MTGTTWDYKLIRNSGLLSVLEDDIHNETASMPRRILNDNSSYCYRNSTGNSYARWCSDVDI